MLLPSAFSCDSSHQAHSSSQAPRTRLQASLFASPPASPPRFTAQNAIGNIFSTCHSLQSMLAAPAPIEGPITPPQSSHAMLPTPPMTHAPAPMKLRLRSHKPPSEVTGLGISTGEPTRTRKRIVKRALPARGPNKRRRSNDDDAGREDDDVESDLDLMADSHETEAQEEELSRPTTPKRARIAPEVLPLGLERSDFHAIDPILPTERSQAPGTDVIVEADGEAWSAEDDRVLVELVLEKLKLSKSDWQDCARSLGKHGSNLSRRWKSLMINGDVGLKRSSRRSKIHGTWR